MVNKNLFNSEVGEVAATTVAKWDWNAVKNALDDSARKFLVSQKNFVEDHSLMNARLIISTITVLFSLYGILHDYFNPFPASRNVLIFCVIAYFISVGVLTAYTQFIEKTCFGAAKQINDQGKPNLWKFSSKQKADSLDVYELEIAFTDGNTNKSKTVVHGNSVSRYFDENGKLCTEIFYKDLAKFCNTLFDEKKSK